MFRHYEPKCEEDFCYAEVEQEAMEKVKSEVIKKALFLKGDRVKIIKVYGSSRLGPNSEAIVLRDSYKRWDSVPIDVVRAHDRDGTPSIQPWTDGHDCQGLAPYRNGRYYGRWIDACDITKIFSISDDDILLLA